MKIIGKDCSTHGRSWYDHHIWGVIACRRCCCSILKVIDSCWR